MMVQASLMERRRQNRRTATVIGLSVALRGYRTTIARFGFYPEFFLARQAEVRAAWGPSS